MLAHRALVFRVPWEHPDLNWLLAEFRLLVNESIRVALRDDIRSRARLTRAAYLDLSARHAVYKQYIPSAYEVALAVRAEWSRDRDDSITRSVTEPPHSRRRDATTPSRTAGSSGTFIYLPRLGERSHAWIAG